jgi:hypothetical protein
MIAPSSMQIQAAIDSTSTPEYQAQHAVILAAQFAQIREAQPYRNDDFYIGYELGLSVARVILAGMPAAVKAGVDI